MIRIGTRKIEYIIIWAVIALQGVGGQPNHKFRAFDWVAYRDPGSITSISEGYSYTYFGSSNGGIYRFQHNGNYFDEPITTAQGLGSNAIHAVHFDKNTGILWTGFRQAVEYTYTREGNWNHLSFFDLGLSSKDRIIAIGSSPNYVWIKAKAIYLKCDHSTGSVLGMYPFPDEGDIEWSSSLGESIRHVEKVFSTYTVMSGWMLTGDQFIDPFGRNVGITTFYLGQYGDFWAGGSDGTIFHGEPNMEVFFPIAVGPLGSTFYALEENGNQFWIGGQNDQNTGGITFMDVKANEYVHFESDITINMTPMNIYDVETVGDDVWFAGEQGLQLYDKDDNYWRFIGEDRGLPSGALVTLDADKTHLWVGGPNGLSRLSLKTRREDPIGIEDIFLYQNVRALLFVDEDLWIATPKGLFVFNTKSPELRSFKEKGTFRLDGPFIGFRHLFFDDNFLYATSNQGVLSLDYENRQWTKVIDASAYRGKTIQSMAIKGDKCFLGFDDALMRFDIGTGFIKEYDFPFMGTVKDIYISNRLLWLATTEGLVKFKWIVDR